MRELSSSASKRADQPLEVVRLEVDVGVDLDDDVDGLGQRARAAQEAVEVARLAAAVGERLVAVGAVARSSGRTQRCSAASSASTAGVPSVEPSSTTTHSDGQVRLRGQRGAEARGGCPPRCGPG